MLQQPPKDPTAALREWAVDVLAKASDVKISLALRESLIRSTPLPVVTISETRLVTPDRPGIAKIRACVDNVSSTSDFVVGQSSQPAATARDAKGNSMPDRQMIWQVVPDSR